MQLYSVIRTEDESGISGIGIIAECCVFSDGKAVIAWCGLEKTKVHSIVV